MSIDMNSYRRRKKLTMSKAAKFGIETYFDIDEEKKEATVNLCYDKPSDIFDNHYMAKEPILNDDFFNEIFYATRVLPSRYFVNYNIYFKDYEGYTEEKLEDIFIKSMMVTNAEWQSEERKSDKMGYFFIVLGAIFLIGLWVCTAILESKFQNISDALPYRVVYYILDILITVILWEAVTISFVKRNEDRARHLSINRRINIITFKLLENKD